MECYKCEKASFVKKKVDFIQLGISLGKFEALVCPVCEETIFEGAVSKQIEEKQKKLNLGFGAKDAYRHFRLISDVKVPKAIAEILKLRKGGK